MSQRSQARTHCHDSPGTLVITAAGGSAPVFHYWVVRGGTTGPVVRTEPGTLSR